LAIFLKKSSYSVESKFLGFVHLHIYHFSNVYALYFLVSHAKNTFDLIAGTGKEENRNNSYILKSAFAQPSGICVNPGTTEGDKVIYIADSESSSIRSITSGGKVMALVGGNRDPCVSLKTGLFCKNLINVLLIIFRALMIFRLMYLFTIF